MLGGAQTERMNFLNEIKRRFKFWSTPVVPAPPAHGHSH